METAAVEPWSRGAVVPGTPGPRPTGGGIGRFHSQCLFNSMMEIKRWIVRTGVRNSHEPPSGNSNIAIEHGHIWPFIVSFFQ